MKGFDYLVAYNAEHPDRLVLHVVHMARNLGPLLAGLAEPPDADEPD